MSQLQETPHVVKTPVRAAWKSNPIIYEINTWVWLNQLSSEYKRAVTLATMPAQALDELAAWRFDAVWLMGVWHRGGATRKSALNYLHEYRQATPDISEADVPGSAFAICEYQVEERFGGRAGLAIFREQLRNRGIKLILDFVPNHVATDHRWLVKHPEYFVRGTAQDLKAQPSNFFPVPQSDGEELAVAHGRDPYFPAWIDTAQLNAFHPGLRRAITDILIEIGHQCDGARCDMAMLATNDIFAQTWDTYIGEPPAIDFWSEIIAAVREVHPKMLLMAEVYWDLEHLLQSQGFDYTYDKDMYDRLVNGDTGAIKAHLSAELSYLQSNIRFIENHDEQRAMESLGEDRQRAAAALICTLPGATLLHQGQIEGRRIKLPVQISRAPAEAENPLLKRFYRRLLREASQSIYQEGTWRMIEPRQIHSADFSHNNLLVYRWMSYADFRLIAINLSGEWARALIEPSDGPRLTAGRALQYDILSDTYAKLCGEARNERGLQLEVPPQGAQVFRFDQV